MASIADAPVLAARAELAGVLRAHRRPCVVTIGTFDGVHAGHRALVARARRLARGRALALTALTFSPRPEQLFKPDAALPDLCPLPERVRRLRDAGADDVVVVPFTRALAALDAPSFVHHLVEDLGARLLCVGTDFALGRGRAGDVAALRALGLPVETVELVCDAAGEKVSSSTLRAARRTEAVA